MALKLLAGVLLLLSIYYTQSYSFRINNIPAELESRIVGGEDVKPHEFPWMAMITDAYGFQLCGGSLLSDSYVLTAGHCVLGVPSENPKAIQVRLGAHNKTSNDEHGVVYRGIERIFRHPEYYPIYHKDFALLKLDRKVIFSKTVRSICLPPAGLEVEGVTAIATGWGRLSEDGMDSEILQKVELPVLNQTWCGKAYEILKENITDDMLCAGGNGKDACQLDSGGPLMWKDKKGTWYQIGIISWGDVCGSLQFPGVYARVPYATEWIKSLVNDINNIFCK